MSVAGIVALLAGIMVAVSVPSSEARKSHSSSTTTPATTTTPTTTTTPPATSPTPGKLRFGIYPWGAAGATSTIAPSVPENADKSMAAVQQLRGSHPLVVHLYADYTGTSNASADGLLSEATWWAANGLQVAAVLRYRPADASKASGFKAWVVAQTRRLVAIRNTISIQIGNEPNNLSPGAGDGSYPGVIGAIAMAIPAARQETVADGRADVLIGFNWAAGATPTTTEPMWGQLLQAGGSAFTQAVGFVGVNVYPGTWSPPAASSLPSASDVDATVRTTLDALRTKHMPTAGIGSSAAIVIGETGYPTTPTRSAAAQDTVLAAVVAAADSVKQTLGVTDVYWFALRDGNTASGQLENGYGLLRDDYSAKPAFESFRQLIATVG